MKTVVMLVGVMCLLAAAPAARATLKIDFGQPDKPVQAGFEGFLGVHEDALSLYTPHSYSAFGATVTLSLSWNPRVPRWEAMQMIDRGGNDGEDTPDLMRDWTGTDNRVYGGPLMLTISGLPADEYEWLSYHHDTEDQTGIFDVVVTDALGSRTFTGIDISHGAKGAGIVKLADVTTFTTHLTSDGSDITFVFSTQYQSGVTPTPEAFFVMNGFILVPEPTTIVLLGLGSLVLRRCRRQL